MSNLQCQIKRYPLLPFAQLVYEMTRWLPIRYTYSETLCWRGGASNKEKVVDALKMAIANHPVFKMRVDWRGLQYYSSSKNLLKGQFYKFKIYTEKTDLFLKVYANHLMSDVYSAMIFLQDIERAYKGLPLEKDDYWGYVVRYEQQKSESHYLNSKAWLEREFADESVPVHPTTDRRWLSTILPPRAGLYEDDYTCIREKIKRLNEEHFISGDGIFSLCVALAIADYCGTDEAALTWAYEGRETEDEQRIFGSLHRDVPFHISKSKIENRESAIRLARNQIRSGIAHSDYSYTLTDPYKKRWNYAVNVLCVPDPEDIHSLTDLPLEMVSFPKQKYAYALLDIEIHEKADLLQLVYRYSATHYKPESIRKFAALVRKYVEWLVND